MRHIACTITIVCAFSFLAWTECPKVSDPPSDTPTVLYTARLLGYVWHQRPEVPEEPVTDLLKRNIECSQEQYPNSILVGMGDNLAPEYESRFDKDGRPKDRVPQGKEFDFNKDPLAQAFPYLRYDAMVPGMEDFYFGTEYLRQLGKYWNGLQDAKPTKVVKMLAANLVIRSAPVTPKHYADVRLDYVSHMDGVSPAFPEFVLPWKPTITVSIDQKSVKAGWQAQLCTATQSPVEIDHPPYKSAESKGCSDVAPLPPQSTSNNSVSGESPLLVFQLPELSDSSRAHLEAGKSYGFCITWSSSSETELGSSQPKAPAPKRFCQPFQVERPFFWPDEKPSFADNQPWFEDVSGHFVVFGVVDPELRGALSRENAAWLDKDKQHSEIAVIPPDVALSQSIEAYRHIHPAVEGETTVAVLLAQMAPASAEALAAQLNPSGKDPGPGFKFDLVLSAADERRSTGREAREIESSTVTGTLSAPLMIPHPIYLTSGDGVLVDPLEAVHIVTKPHGKTYHHEPFMPVEASQNANFNKLCANDTNLYLKLNAYAQKILEQRYPTTSKKNPAEECSKIDALKCLTLSAIRDELDTDLAMLQQWNFFKGCVYRPQGKITNIGPVELLESLRRAVWAASYLARVTITGAKLKTVLDASAKIANSQKSSTYTSLLHDRDLAYIGVTKKDKIYYVNGQPIEDTRIYSIATDDSLAVGNSEYPDLVDATFAAPEIFRDDVADTTISFVYDAFRLAPGPYSTAPADPARSFRKDDIMAAADGNWPAPDHRHVFGPEQKTVEFAQSLVPSESPIPKDGPAAERSVQGHRILSVTLQNLTGSFAFSKPNRTDLGVQQIFSGVTNTNVIQAHSEKYSTSDAFRLNWSGARFNFGADEQTAFGRSRQGSLSGGKDSVNLTSNLLLVSPFVEYNLHRWTPHWKLVLRPIDYLSDLANTQLLLLSAVKNQNFNLTVQPRNNLQTRFGARFEKDAVNFFEFGYIHRDALNVLAALTFNAGTPTAFFCPLDVPQSAGTCASQVKPVAGSVPVQVLGSFQQNGAYWTTMFTVPILKLSYVFGSDGDLFASSPGHDVSPLTRYAVNIDNSLKVPIWGNLALAPHFGVFLFEDQVLHATLTRTIADVQLTYYFDWHQGLHWRDVLTAPTAPPAAATAGQSASGLPSTPIVLK